MAKVLTEEEKKLAQEMLARARVAMKAIEHYDQKQVDRLCQAVCEPRITIDWQIYHNVYQNELRRLGVNGFLEYPFAEWFKRNAEATFTSTLGNLQTCTKCGKCEQVCPYHLPIMDMIEHIKEQQADLIQEIKKAGWSETYRNASSPLPANSIPTLRPVKKYPAK